MIDGWKNDSMSVLNDSVIRVIRRLVIRMQRCIAYPSIAIDPRTMPYLASESRKPPNFTNERTFGALNVGFVDFSKRSIITAISSGLPKREPFSLFARNDLNLMLILVDP